MSAPDRIWAWEYKGNTPWGEHKPDLEVVHNGAEYTRIDPNTRVVTVEQLERWAALIGQLDIQDDHGWNIGDKSVSEIRAIIDEVKP